MSEQYFHTTCQLCGSSELRTLFPPDHFLTKCRSCNFVFSRKIASQEVLQQYYNGYPLENRISEITIERYNQILDLLEPFRTSGKLLEFGCGEGYFMEVARKRNWKTEGIELSDTLQKVCRDKGFATYHDIVEIKDLNSYDVIVSIEVIEHIDKPHYFLKSFNKLLKPGGALYMTTPNFNCLSRRLIGKKWNNIIYPEHLSYFTKSTIDKVLEAEGFKKIKCITTGISFARYKHSLLNWNKKEGEKNINYDYNEKDRILRDQIEKRKGLIIIKNIINYILNFFSLGESLKILYVKK